MRRVNVDIKVDALFNGLGKDDDKVLVLEEIIPKLANAMATFQRWARETFGSCVKLWDTKEARALRGPPPRRVPLKLQTHPPKHLAPATKAEDNKPKLKQCWVPDCNMLLSSFKQLLLELEMP